jgi:pantetheine-phosphate adenylyltransferase
MTTAVYAGSFDPVTLGHLDVIQRAAKCFDTLVIGIGINSAKKTLFTSDERAEMLLTACRTLYPDVYAEVARFDGLLVNFCQKLGAKVIIRGLRAVTDFEYELGIAHANSSQAPEVYTFFLPTKPEFSFVSSSVVRELAKHGGKLDHYVPKNVEEALRKKFT